MAAAAAVHAPRTAPTTVAVLKAVMVMMVVSHIELLSRYI